MQQETLRYTRDHEWIGEEGGLYKVGITAHAQDQLGDITYVELPEVGKTVKQGDEVAVVESVKAASDVYAPAGGTVAEVNGTLEDTPELVNQDPYGEGWFLKLKDVDTAQLDALMDHAAYEQFVADESA